MSLNSAPPVTTPMSLSDLVTDTREVKREAAEMEDTEDVVSGHTAIKRHTIDAILGLPRLGNGFRHHSYPGGEHLGGQLRDPDLCGDGASYSESDDLPDKDKHNLDADGRNIIHSTYFLAPTGALGMTISVCLCQSCLEPSFFLLFHISSSLELTRAL